MNCPNCNSNQCYRDEWETDGAFPSFGPWTCDDCGWCEGYEGEVDHRNPNAELPRLLNMVKDARDCLRKGMNDEGHAILFGVQEILAQAVANDRGLNFITKDRLKGFPLMLTDPEHMDDLQDAGNCDIQEGSEWLPWYKMSLHMLVISAAKMMAAADHKEGCDARRSLCEEAGKYFYDHLMLCGIGPRQDNPEVVERCKETCDRWLEHYKKGTL